MQNCDIRIIGVHRASYAKHLSSRKHLENEKQIDMIITKWLFQEPLQNRPRKINNPKSLKQIARHNFTLDYKQSK